MALDVLQGRPVIENTPSGLKRITRFKKLNAEGAKAANLSTYFEAYGTADVEFTTALLVEQRIDRRSEQGIDVSLVKVYQELADNALTATTEVTESTAFDGRRVTRTTYLCKASQAATLRPAIGSGSPAVFQVDVEINGPVAKVITSAIAITNAGFVLSTTNDTRNNGALLIRNIRTVGGAPSTPSGYTLTSDSTQQVDGYTVYNYSFAKGEGQISREDGTSNNGALLTASIRYLTVPGTLGTPGTNPIATPSGYTLVSESYQEADGHRVWSASYAKGDGQISQSDDTNNNGALLLRTIRHLVAPATANPIATPSGYTATQAAYDDRDGHRIWTATFAKGSGEISRDIDYAQSTDQGSTGITRTTIRYLVAPSATIQPTTLSGSVLVGQSVSEQDGHRVWTTQWAKGTGTVTSTNTTREGGNLIIYRRTALGTAPSAPSATRGGTVAIVDDLSRTENGITVYDRTWAEGNGEVSRQTSIDKLGNLLTYTIRHLTAFTVTSNPTSVSGATVIGSTFTDQDGYRLWVVVWRKTISSTAQSVTQTQPDGSIIYTVTDYTGSSATPADPTGGSAYLVKLTEEMNDGFIITTAVYHKPPADYTFPKTISFTMPGLATAGNPPQFDPPVTKKLKATFYVSYSTSQNSDTPYTVNSWSQFLESYLPLGSFLYQGNLRALDGYLGSSTAGATANVSYRGVSVTQWANTVTASDPVARPTGPTVIDTDCEIYLTATNGTKVYRNVSVKYTF